MCFGRVNAPPGKNMAANVFLVSFGLCYGNLSQNPQRRIMTVKIEGLDAIVKKLDSLGKPGAFKRPMTRAVKHLYGKMKKEPTKSGTWSSWADHNPASRLAYCAKVASGEASLGTGGYQRSH